MTDNSSKRPCPTTFAELGIAEPLLRVLERMHWTDPTEIQQKMIPPALAGKDILGQAQTGTGKTGGFALPILQRLEHDDAVRCLMLAPTRELAAQVADEVARLARFTEHRLVVCYGGTRLDKQAQKLRQNPAIVVGTPGRIMDLMGRRLLRLNRLKFAVLDEVDRMLDIGFRDDIRRILGGVRCRHQTIFVSATINDEINHLARQYMTSPTEVFCAPDKLTVDEVEQCYLTVESWDKTRLLVHLIKQEHPEHALVFTRTKRQATRVAQRLKKAGIDAREIHGDLFQGKRSRIMDSFRRGDLHVLVATDLASRGLDIDDISHVINYDIPEDAEVYVHRIGRTARMGQSGKALTFVTREQGELLTDIEVLINCEVPQRTLAGFEASQREPLEQEPPRRVSAATTAVAAARQVQGRRRLPGRRRRL